MRYARTLSQIGTLAFLAGEKQDLAMLAFAYKVLQCGGHAFVVEVGQCII